MKKIRCAVVGVGYLGAFHVEKYQQCAEVEFIGVCDSDSLRVHEIAEKYQTKAFLNYQELIGLVDAVSIVVPTIYHFDIARFFLEHGVHVLLEKPMTETLHQAQELNRLALAQNLILQVGHIEHFNPVFTAAKKLVRAPYHIEARRLTPFRERGVDVSVVLDLMIHDIGLIQSLIQSPLKKVSTQGKSLKTDTTDEVIANLEFENGTTASLHASRISQDNERMMQIFEDNCILFLDLKNKTFSRKEGEAQFSCAFNAEQSDTLKLEVVSFLNSIIHHQEPVFSGEDGYQALKLAYKIMEMIEEKATIQESSEQLIV